MICKNILYLTTVAAQLQSAILTFKNFDVKVTTCLLDVTHVLELKDNTDDIFHVNKLRINCNTFNSNM